MRFIFFIIFLLIGITSALAQDRSERLRDGFFVFRGDFENRHAIFNEDGKYDLVAAIQLVTNYFKPLVFVSEFDHDSSKRTFAWGQFDGTFDISPQQYDSLEFGTRAYFAVTAGGGVNYFVEVSAEGNYEYIFEIDHMLGDPGFNLSVTIDPAELMFQQRLGEITGKRRIVLFSKRILAPSLFIEHTLGKASTSVAIPLYFSTKGKIEWKKKQVLSNRFVLRQYDSIEAMEAILKAPDSEQMFKKVPPNTPIKYGASIDPQSAVFNFEGTRYMVNTRYASHLVAEGVRFKILATPTPLPNGVQPIFTLNNAEFVSSLEALNPKVLSQLKTAGALPTVSDDAYESIFRTATTRRDPLILVGRDASNEE